MKDGLEYFYVFWQQVLPYNERPEFAENFINWDDSINNAYSISPKALGFVSLSPTISLTVTGK